MPRWFLRHLLSVLSIFLSLASKLFSAQTICFLPFLTLSQRHKLIMRRLNTSSYENVWKVFLDKKNLDDCNAIVNDITKCLVKHEERMALTAWLPKQSILPQLQTSLRSFVLLQQVKHRITAKAATPFDTQNTTHEDMLNQLWQSLKPSTPLASRISHQWGDIGFQGNDPITDFRGMGILSLYCLLFYCRRFPDTSKRHLELTQRAETLYPPLPFTQKIIRCLLMFVVSLT
eukprot:c6993_g1_i1.p1 GENE.c6993_g1_i1~~c6993_g1_i1.p1  ORF type:complete len:231 (-),score=53.17 c6993_g1_i1:41-733(-)